LVFWECRVRTDIDQVLRPCLVVPVGGAQDSASSISYQRALAYRVALDKWVRQRWEECRVRESEKPTVRAAVEEWLRSLWRSPKNPNGLAPKTVRSIWNVMKVTFKFGVKSGHLIESPMGEKRVELPHASTERTNTRCS
jgi:hypothetical protein